MKQKGFWRKATGFFLSAALILTDCPVWAENDISDANMDNAQETSSETVERTYSMVLTGSDFVYTGEEVCPGAVVYYGDEQVDDGAYVLSYSENVDAGTATAFAMVDGHTLSQTFTIEPKEVLIRVDSASKTYGDPDPVFTGSISGLVGEDSLGEVRYVRNEDGEEAGTVELTAQVSEANPNYTYEVSGGTLTIGKRDLVIASTLSEVTYGEDFPEDVLSYLAVAEGSLVYGDTLSGIGLSYDWKTKGKDAGDHLMNIRISGESPNYNVSVRKTGYTIVPRTVDVSWPQENSFSFNGDEQTYEPVLSGFAYGESTVSPTLEGEHAVEGGEYTCIVTGLEGEGASNYSLPADGLSGAWKITPVELEMQLDSVQKVYDGEAVEPEVTAPMENPQWMPAVRTAFRAEGTSEWTEGNPVQAGIYDVKAISEETGNFVQTERIFEQAVTIEKRDAVVRIPDAQKAYHEADPDLGVGIFENEVKGDADLAAIDLQAVRIGGEEDPGVYEETLDLTEDAKAGLEILNNYTVEIAKGSFTIVESDALTVSAEDVQAVYDGEPHTVSPQASIEGAEIFYFNEESGAYDLTKAPSVENVAEGTLEVLFKASLFGYKDAEGSASVEILPTDAVVQAVGKSLTCAYTGEEILVSGVDFENVPEGVEILTAEGIEAKISEKDVKIDENGIGEYKMGLDESSFIVAGDAASNYKIQLEVTDGSLMILPITPEFAVSCGEKTYDGQPAEAEYQIGCVPADASQEPVITYSYSADGENFEEGLPVHAGQYTVKAVLEPLNGNYEGCETQCACTILPMDVEVIGEAQSRVYDGTADTVILLSMEEIPQICSLTFAQAEGSFEDADAGEGKRVSLAEDSVEILECMYGEISDFNLILPSELAADVKPLEAELSWSADELPYNGKEQTVTAQVLNQMGTDEFALEYASNTALERGTYTAQAVDLGNPNYRLPADASHTFEITMGKAAIRISGTRIALDWNQSEQAAEGYSFEVTDGPEGSGQEIFVSLAEGKEAKASGQDVGDYYMGLTLDDFTVESANYEVTVSEFADGCLTILKANKIPELGAVQINGAAAEADVLGAYTGKIGDVLTVEIKDLTTDDFDLFSSDAAVASPSGDGSVELIGYGEALITVSVHETDNYLAQELSFHIRVGKNNGEVAFGAGGVEVNYLSETAVIPEDEIQAASYTLTSLTPEICLVIGDDGVPSSQAVCSGNGQVYGRMPGEGSIEIRIPENDRFTEAVLTISVTVEKADRRVQFTEREVTMDPTAEAFCILPQSDGDETTVVWSSADPQIAQAGEDGTITPMGEESEGVQITALYEENAYYKEAQDSYRLILAHNWELDEEEHLDPTCTEKGYTGVYHCTNPGCEAVRYETEIEALGHDLVQVEAKEATDSEPGMDAHWACSRCEALFADENGEIETTEAMLTVNHVIVPVQAVVVYDGRKHRPKDIRAVAEGSVLVYSLDGENFETKVPGFKDAGTYTIYVKAEHPEYRDSEAASVVLTISPKTITVNGEKLQARKVYDGNITAKVVGELTAEGVLEGEDAGITCSRMEATYDSAKPGKHTVTVCITGLAVSNPNYRLENDTVTLQIEGLIRRPAVTPAAGGQGQSGNNPGGSYTGGSYTGGSTQGGSTGYDGSGAGNGTAGSGTGGSSIDSATLTTSATPVPEENQDEPTESTPAQAAQENTPTPAPTVTVTETPVPTEAAESELTKAPGTQEEIGEAGMVNEEEKTEETEEEKNSIPILPIGIGLAALILVIVLLLKKKAA